MLQDWKVMLIALVAVCGCTFGAYCLMSAYAELMLTHDDFRIGIVCEVVGVIFFLLLGKLLRDDWLELQPNRAMLG